MDRNLLRQAFRRESPPDWICPTCFKGILRIDPKSFSQQELRHSRAAASHDEWEPDWTQYVYSCMLECTNDKCKETVASVGTGEVRSSYEWIDEDNYQQIPYTFYQPQFFEPHLALIPIPETCPESVAQPLNESFKLFFSSPSAASNCIRSALEELLTQLKVKRFQISNGKRHMINLHRRIELLPAKYASHKHLLLAVKWLGNAGSHGHDQVSVDDVMDAYQLVSHILDEVYTRKGEKLQALATKVNKNKGPSK